MKQVIVILLLSVSVCINRADLQSGVPQVPQQSPSPQEVPKSNAPENTVVTPISNQTTQNATVSVKNTTEAITENTNKTEASSGQTTEKPQTTVKPEITTDKPSTEKVTSAPTVVTTTKNEKVISTSTDKPDEKKDITPKANDTTTHKPELTTVVPVLQTRAFDGASFVGGIILTLGILAIGFMGFKYYKNQTERNYHTL